MRISLTEMFSFIKQEWGALFSCTIMAYSKLHIQYCGDIMYKYPFLFNRETITKLPSCSYLQTQYKTPSVNIMPFNDVYAQSSYLSLGEI